MSVKKKTDRTTFQSQLTKPTRMSKQFSLLLLVGLLSVVILSKNKNIGFAYNSSLFDVIIENNIRTQKNAFSSYLPKVCRQLYSLLKFSSDVYLHCYIYILTGENHNLCAQCKPSLLIKQFLMVTKIRFQIDGINLHFTTLHLVKFRRN